MMMHMSLFAGFLELRNNFFFQETSQQLHSSKKHKMLHNVKARFMFRVIVFQYNQREAQSSQLIFVLFQELPIY